MRHPGRALLAAGGGLLLALAAVAGCSSGKQPAGTVKYVRSIGPGEGSLTVVTFNGFTESGGNDPRVDWVSQFQQDTQCQVSVKYAASAQEIVSLMSDKNRAYDVVSAPGEAAGQLIDTKQVAQLNSSLIDGYKNLQPALRTMVKRGTKVYGVPFVWGSNIVMYDTKTVQPAPEGLSALFDPARFGSYTGKIVMRGTPMTLADAALYLRSKDHKLGITDPYELTPKQLAAAQAVISRQKAAVQAYYKQPYEAVSAFAGDGAVLGQVSAYQLDVLSRAGRPVQGVQPKEGVTGWADSWMMGARAAHPDCAYEWLKWMSRPDTQSQVAQWNGVAPANPGACGGTAALSQQFCASYHVNDRSYVDKVLFAKTPERSCGADRRDCTDYAAWTIAWRDALK